MSNNKPEKPSITQLMNMAEEMQKNMQEMQKKLGEKEIIGKAGGGGIEVLVKMNGKMEMLGIKMSPDARAAKDEILDEIIVSAVNQAIQKAQGLTKDAMVDIYQKIGMPFQDEEK